MKTTGQYPEFVHCHAWHREPEQWRRRLPSLRIVTEALVRYIWQQEDATAYTMWQLLEPQSETIRTGLAEMFGCDREEIAITRNASRGSRSCSWEWISIGRRDTHDDAGLPAHADHAQTTRTS